MHAGAAEATAADIDPFAAAAIALNARENGRRVAVVRRDVLDEAPPDVDVILAGDCWYDAGLATKIAATLMDASEPFHGTFAKGPMPVVPRNGRSCMTTSFPMACPASSPG